MTRAAALPAIVAALALAACGEEERPEPAPRGDPGLRVWAAQGCGSCHTFRPAGSTATIGPNLENSLAGRSEDYIRESIVAPDAKVTGSGGGESIMPQDYGRRIRRPDLDALVTFIAEGAKDR